jgi:hypothetical protein
VLVFLISIEIAIYGPSFFDPETANDIQSLIGYRTPGLMLPSILTGFTVDVQK